DLAERRVAVGAGELAFGADLDRAGEDEDVDLDGDGGPGDHLPGVGEVGQLHVELDGGADQAEDVDLSAEPEVAGQGTLLTFQPHVDADRGRDRPGCDAEVDREAGGRLEADLEDV